jgi:hypothetical protein
MRYAEKPAKLLNDGTTAEEPSRDCGRARRLCYEIEKLEGRRRDRRFPRRLPRSHPCPQGGGEKPKSLWARISLETSSGMQEAPSFKKKKWLKRLNGLVARPRKAQEHRSLMGRGYLCLSLDERFMRPFLHVYMSNNFKKNQLLVVRPENAGEIFKLFVDLDYKFTELSE